jgi:iron complex outermembrane receptor protein
MALAGGAHAQTQTKTGETTVDEVIVTAEKRSESLQDVPVAVSAYTAETRQLIGISTIQDLANFTPGLSFSGSQDRVFIRGVGRQTNTNGSDPGVATYTDGVYDASTRSVSASDFFVERVEILRGPQGTLYGRNSIGGAINAIANGGLTINQNGSVTYTGTSTDMIGTGAININEDGQLDFCRLPLQRLQKFCDSTHRKMR